MCSSLCWSIWSTAGVSRKNQLPQYLYDITDVQILHVFCTYCASICSNEVLQNIKVQELAETHISSVIEDQSIKSVKVMSNLKLFNFSPGKLDCISGIVEYI